MPPTPVHGDLWFFSTIAARTLIVLILLALGLRLLGKRQIGQMNVYDLAMIMAVANGVQNAMTQGDGRLGTGLASAGVLILAGRVLTAFLIRRPSLEERLCGIPTVIVNNGHLVTDHMRREHVTQEQVMAALRQHSITSLKQVQMAILEIDGSISIVEREAKNG